VKKIILGSGVAMLMLAGSAQAIEGSVQVGERFTNMSVGLGTTTPGLSLSGNWLRSDHDGNVSGLGLGYNIGIGSVFLSPGVKAMYISPKDTKDGYSVAVGGGVQVPVTNMLGVYGEYYYSPESFSSRIDRYQEASAGVSFSPITLLDVRVGYKYLAMDGKNGRKDNVLANGPYMGASLRF